MRILEFIGPAFEDSELLYPYYRLQEDGHEVILVGTEKKEYKGKNGVPMVAERTFKDTDMKDFDALVIPGGSMPDKVRMDEDAIRIVKDAFKDEKPVGAICHGGQILINAEVVKDMEMTSVVNIRKDLENAGAKWMDKESHTYRNLVTAQKPPHLPKWMKEFTELLSKK